MRLFVPLWRIWATDQVNGRPHAMRWEQTGVAQGRCSSRPKIGSKWRTVWVRFEAVSCVESTIRVQASNLEVSLSDVWRCHPALWTDNLVASRRELQNLRPVSLTNRREGLRHVSIVLAIQQF